MAAPVMGDDAIALLHKVEQLRIPVVAAQGPAVMQDDSLTRAPVLIEDLNAILCGDRAHRLRSFAWVRKKKAGSPAIWAARAFGRPAVTVAITPPVSATAEGRPFNGRPSLCRRHRTKRCCWTTLVQVPCQRSVRPGVAGVIAGFGVCSGCV